MKTERETVQGKETTIMAKYRETVCKFYIAKGECRKGREAVHYGYCQHCGKYVPRKRERHVNKKKQKLERIRKEDYGI